MQTNLKEIDGAVMLTVPSDMLEQLDLHAGNVVSLEVQGERLIVQSRRRPRYTMQELLAQRSHEHHGSVRAHSIADRRQSPNRIPKRRTGARGPGWRQGAGARQEEWSKP